MRRIGESSSTTGLALCVMSLMTDRVSSADPRPLLGEVHAIVANAMVERRDLTPDECYQCDALLQAAEALSRLQYVPRAA
jgi:hypothetical protein